MVIDRSGGSGADQGCPAVLVSACLLGVACAHDGEGRPVEAVVALGATRRLVPVCPETAGGLPTPRVAAERSAGDGRVRTAAGVDVTEAYERGARHAVAVARASGATTAVLKARSPSCGCHEVYDGSFTRTLVAGEGVTAEALRRAGLEVVSEEDLAGVASGGTGRATPAG
jgi:uncharacterized protein YbbK (DUF523 family)